MNPIRRIRRFAAALAAFGAAFVMLTAAPAAFAMRVPPPGGPMVGSPLPQTRTVTHTVVVGGMPGWQIALIAAGTAVLAAAVAVSLDRARTARRHTLSPAT